MAVGNFAHLAEFDPALAALGRFSERYFFEDPNTSLLKTRQFAERFTLIIGETLGVDLERTETFSEMLRVLQVDRAAPHEILDILHRLRKTGNRAAHDLHGERREAFDAIKLCHQLGVWMRAVRTGAPKLTIAFKPPRIEEDASPDYA